MKATIEGGIAGVIIDCRGRQPLALPEDPKKRIAKLIEWIVALDAYPQEAFQRIVESRQ